MAQVQPMPGAPQDQAPPPQYSQPAPVQPPMGYGAPAPANNNNMINNTIVMAPPAAPAPTTTVIVTEKKDNACRAAIPAMHIGMAVFCLLLNIFFPGIGTIVAGFSVFCCGNPGQDGAGKVGTMCLNFWVGLLQLGTVWFFLLGWIWSIMWGAAMLGMSADYHSDGGGTTVVTTGAGGATVVKA
ncbi:protein SPEC3-like [Diadema antillarum]|uniref:protein SPEC3-like n=1 Tax=Diadema antillarum TaxID=105358 RepID=UPI003A8A6624